MDLVYIWYDDKYWSKLSFTTVSTLPVTSRTLGNFSKLEFCLRIYFNFNLETTYAISLSDMPQPCDMDLWIMKSRSRSQT